MHYGYRSNETTFRKNIDILSYKSSFTKSTKQLSLRKVDINFNIWSHTSAYKYTPQEVGLKLRKLYDVGEIKTQVQFENKLKLMMERILKT